MGEPGFLRETRESYDVMADGYAEWVRDLMDVQVWDRAVLAGFAELVRGGGGGPVVDVGCGPGRVSAHLHELGLDVSGIDLSPEMVATARRAYPHLRFDVGSMTDLALPDGSVAGIVAWYSVIHVPDDVLPGVFAAFRRALAPGGHLLVAFQVGDESVRHTEAWGRPVSLTFRRRRPEQVADLLVEAGLTVQAHLVRAPETHGDVVDRTPQAYLVARRPTDAAPNGHT